MLNCLSFCLGPVVGEFPAQNDVNLAPAPSLPQVMCIHLSLCSISTAVLVCNILTCPSLSLQPTLVQDMTEFKRSLPLFPLAKPFTHINFMAAKLWGPSSMGGCWGTLLCPSLPPVVTGVWNTLIWRVCKLERPLEVLGSACDSYNLAVVLIIAQCDSRGHTQTHFCFSLIENPTNTHSRHCIECL